MKLQELSQTPRDGDDEPPMSFAFYTRADLEKVFTELSKTLNCHITPFKENSSAAKEFVGGYLEIHGYKDTRRDVWDRIKAILGTHKFVGFL